LILTVYASEEGCPTNYPWVFGVSPESFSLMLHCFWIFLLLKELITCTEITNGSTPTPHVILDKKQTADDRTRCMNKDQVI